MKSAPKGKKVADILQPLTLKQSELSGEIGRRIMAELPEKVYYRYTDHGIAVNLYTNSNATLELESGTSVTLIQEADYPNSGHVVFHVMPSKESAFALRLRIPRWCRSAAITINNESPIPVPADKTEYELFRTWKKGDTITLELPMIWRFVRGHQLQEGKVALMRGPIVYCLGTAQNEEVLKKYPNFNGVVVDPNSLGEPEADSLFRPDGIKVKATARVEAAGAWSKGAPHETLTFSEFIDPSGIVTYFHVLDLGKAEEDELVGDFTPIKVNPERIR